MSQKLPATDAPLKPATLYMNCNGSLVEIGGVVDFQPPVLARPPIKNGKNMVYNPANTTLCFNVNYNSEYNSMIFTKLLFISATIADQK